MYKDLAWTWPIISPPADYEDEASQFITAIEKYAKIPVKTLLDLGSGGGHNDIHLKKHYKVTGMDMSPEMITNAHKLNPDVEYFEGDMRTARLDKKFDAILLADAVMYMTSEEDLLAAFKTAYFHLNPGGVLCTYVEETSEKFQENQTEVSYRGSDGVKIVYMENQRRTGSQTHQCTMLYIIKKNNETSIEAETHNFGLFSQDTWHRLLEQTGFEVNVMEFHDEDDFPMFACVKREAL